LRDNQVVVPEIDDIAVRIVTEEVSLRVAVKQPRTPYMVSNGFVGDLRVLDAVDRTTVFAWPINPAFGSGAAM
jgi:hypothetical protein